MLLEFAMKNHSTTRRDFFSQTASAIAAAHLAGGLAAVFAAGLVGVARVPGIGVIPWGPQPRRSRG